MDIFTTLITEPLANGLILSYQIAGQNMGLGIILFTLVLVIILYPLTKPYMESMQKMREHQDDLNKLKKKHKDDKIKYAQAQADFFKEKGIKNPSAGCLPYLLQIVILIAFFRLFINTFSVGNGQLVSKFNQYLYPPLHFEESETINTNFLYLDITQPDIVKIAGLALPGPLLITAAAIQFISTKITQPYVDAEKRLAKKTPEKTDDAMAATQSYMIYLFPFMTLWIGTRFPSGLALYWLIFSGNQALRQYRASGWGGLTPWLEKLGLVQLPETNGKSKKGKKNS